MVTLELLLDRRNRWQQVMNLKVFGGAKDIFRDNLPQDTSHQQDFKLTLGAISPVPLYEFELRELFIAASVQSGCKWWTRYSRASKATVNVRQCLWSTRFVCRHYEAEYQKRPSDNSRANCVMPSIGRVVDNFTTDFTELFTFQPPGWGRSTSSPARGLGFVVLFTQPGGPGE